MDPSRLVSKYLAVFLSLSLISMTAFAQRSSDEDDYAKDWQAKPERGVAGVFDYYALVLSWSPTYCSDRTDNGFDLQCDRSDGRRYAFVLHGLWPQYEKGFPGLCRTRKKPFVPQPVIDNMLDIMPSPRLVVHEYKKHGACSGLDPAAYYDVSRKLFRSIRIPKRYVNPYESQFVGVDELESDFLSVNPDLRADMISISCGGAGSRLREIRICFTKEGKPRACGSNEEQRRLCRAEKMFLPPVRSSRTDPDTAEQREKLVVPQTARPRVIESLR
jgi:ribonuclease T2